jgi:hypothetical protein
VPAISLVDLLAGILRLIGFLREHRIATTVGLDHLAKAGIEPLLIDRSARDRSKERWLTPDYCAGQFFNLFLLFFWRTDQFNIH